MYLFEYLDGEKLSSHVRNGLVDVRHHRVLPLDIYTYSKRTVYDNAWDDVTTKCRGLIVGSDSRIIARPFEKFFNVDTSYRPETHMANLPAFPFPLIAEKLDGSLGTLYRLPGYKHGIATKGSFHSEQADWATRWYHQHCVNPQWPEGYTPVFEIIAESIQHHVVHYGHEEMVLLALINNETGEESDYNTVYHWAHINGVRPVDIYYKSLDSVVLEDRPNKEGYVLSWPQPGKPPLKVKVKHSGFLSLQKVVHAATPKAILEALSSGNADLVSTWIGQTNDPTAQWIQTWVARFNFKYGEILVKSREAYTKAAMLAGLAPEGERRKVFAQYLLKEFPEVARIAFATLDDKDFRTPIWELVEKKFEAELSKPFALEAV